MYVCFRDNIKYRAKEVEAHLLCQYLQRNAYLKTNKINILKKDSSNNQPQRIASNGIIIDTFAAQITTIIYVMDFKPIRIGLFQR